MLTSIISYFCYFLWKKKCIKKKKKKKKEGFTHNYYSHQLNKLLYIYIKINKINN